MEILESGRKKIKELENLLENIQLDSAKLFKERDLKIDFLSKELKKNVNTQYIKNILLKFFDSDVSVRNDNFIKITKLDFIGTRKNFASDSNSPAVHT